MKWGRFPFTNVVGDRSVTWKPEGFEFSIIANPIGVKLVGESPSMTSQEDLETFAQTLSEAFQVYRWYNGEKLKGN